MVRQARISASKPSVGRSVRAKNARTPARKPARRASWLIASFGGLGLIGSTLCGCVTVAAGAAAGMLASRSAPETTVQTPTAGDSIDQMADSAGAALARTIKENVPGRVRSIPTGAPKVVVNPHAKPTPTIIPTRTASPSATPTAKPATDETESR